MFLKNGLEMNSGTNFYSALKPCGRILDLKAQGWTVWDCSPISGSAGSDWKNQTCYGATAGPRIYSM